MSDVDKLLLLAAGLFLVLLGIGLAGFIRTAPRKRKGKGRGDGKPDLSQFSKWVVADVRPLLWVVTIGGGITYDAAKAANFNVPQEPEGSVDSPAI